VSKQMHRTEVGHCHRSAESHDLADRYEKRALQHTGEGECESPQDVSAAVLRRVAGADDDGGPDDRHHYHEHTESLQEISGPVNRGRGDPSLERVIALRRQRTLTARRLGARVGVPRWSVLRRERIARSIPLGRDDPVGPLLPVPIALHARVPRIEVPTSGGQLAHSTPNSLIIRRP
jgi:hypothetical protein